MQCPSFRPRVLRKKNPNTVGFSGFKPYNLIVYPQASDPAASPRPEVLRVLLIVITAAREIVHPAVFTL